MIQYTIFDLSNKQIKHTTMKKYLNLRTVYGVETVDELNTEDFKTLSDFNRELKRLKSEYRLSNMNVYSSQRATKEWNN